MTRITTALVSHSAKLLGFQTSLPHDSGATQK